MISQWTNDDFGSKRPKQKKIACFVLRPYRLVSIHRHACPLVGNRDTTKKIFGD
jgi:hypothetical protein